MHRRAASDPGWIAMVLAAIALILAIRADIKAGEVVESDKRLTRAIDNLGKVIENHDR